MAKPKKQSFTFKKEPRETGMRSVGHPYQDVHIKLNKKKVGYIQAESWSHPGWTIRFTVRRQPTKEAPCPFYWHDCITAGSEEQARQWIKDNTEDLLKLDLFWRDEE